MIGFTAIQKIKGQKHLTEAAQHNTREMYARGCESGKINHGLSHLNYSLGGEMDSPGILAKWIRLRNEAGVPTPGRSNEISAIEIVFSLPKGAQDHIDLGNYFLDCTNFACEWFGGPENLLSSDVHLDQEQPHCHVLMLPLVGGKMDGASMFRKAGPGYSLLHGDFHRRVGRRHGLRKAEPRLQGKAKQLAADAVLAALEPLPDGAPPSRRAIEPLIHKAIQRDPGPYMAALGIGTPTDSVRKRKTIAELATSVGRGPKTRAGAERADRKMLERANEARRNQQAHGDGEEGYSLSLVPTPEPRDQQACAIAFRPEELSPPASPPTSDGTLQRKGYALYSLPHPSAHFPEHRSPPGRHRMTRTSAAIGVMLPACPQATMGAH